MASIIRIKRSSVSGNPSTLGAGELAYSNLTDNGSNGGDRLYIGMGTEIAGNAANHVVIGGKYFTDKLDHAPGTLTASSALIVDANSKLDNLKVDNLDLNGNTLSSINTNGDINITPNGTGKTVISNLYIGSASLDEYIQDVSGAGINNSSEILSSYDNTTNTTTLSLATTTVTAGSYGSSTQIPTFTVDSKGRLTAAGSVSVATDLAISGDDGVDTISLLTDTLSFIGGEGIDVIVTNGTVTVSGEYASSSNAGIASFSANSFDVSGTGNVTIKAGGVSNSQLANSDVTIGSTTISLGGTSTSLAGLTELTVDNLNINGNQIESTNANGDIVLNPDGTGSVDVSGARITNVAEPTLPTDAATKNYVDNAVTGLTWKNSVNLLSNVNIALTGSSSTLVIDGHAALSASDDGYRILLTGQTTPSQNGIYVYTDNGTSYTLQRSADANTFQELVGAAVFVKEGVAYANTGWVQSFHYLTNFDSQTWIQFSGAGAYSAGAGLGQSGTEFFVKVAATGGLEIVNDELAITSTVAGNGLTYANGVINVEGTANRISVDANSVDIASTYAGQTSITTLGTITTGTWNADTISVNKGGTGLTSYSAGDLLYASGATTLTKLSAGDTGKVLQISAQGLPIWADIDGGTY